MEENDIAVQVYTELGPVLQNTTVEKLRIIIRSMNDSGSVKIKISGNKSELLQRIKASCAHLAIQDYNRYRSIRLMIEQTTGLSIASPTSAIAIPTPTPSYHPVIPPVKIPLTASAGGIYSRESLPRMADARPHPIVFRPSPFYTFRAAISGSTRLLRANPGERRAAHLMFQLTPEQVQLVQNSARYQVRLFCTNELFYTQGLTPQAPAPLDFPQQCEIRLNSYPVHANTKSIKKRVGTVAPVDLTRVANGAALTLRGPAPNKIELVYANTELCYFMAVYLVEVPTVAELVAQIRARPVAAGRGEDGYESDGSVSAGAFELRLTDPLSFTHLNLPVKSSQCPHVPCFDATIFLTMNEQTPTWKCPICNRDITFEELEVSAFMQDILARVPSSYDAVMMEEDGSWHTEDNKYGSNISAASAGGAGGGTGGANSPFPGEPSVANSPAPAAADRQSMGELTIDDSDDDTSGDYADATDATDAPDGTDSEPVLSRPRRKSPPSVASPVRGVFRSNESRPQRTGHPPPAVIDLTLSDDDNSNDNSNTDTDYEAYFCDADVAEQLARRSESLINVLDRTTPPARPSSAELAANANRVIRGLPKRPLVHKPVPPAPQTSSPSSEIPGAFNFHPYSSIASANSFLSRTLNTNTFNGNRPANGSDPQTNGSPQPHGAPQTNGSTQHLNGNAPQTNGNHMTSDIRVTSDSHTTRSHPERDIRPLPSRATRSPMPHPPVYPTNQN